MNCFSRRLAAAAICFSCSLPAGTWLPAAAQTSEKDPKAQDSRRPRLTLKAQPQYGIAPLRVVLTAELVGGPNDFEEFYCPTVRWEWDDDTSSEASADCTPYEAGKSDIKRRFIVEHKFEHAGAYKVYVRLKRRDKEVAAASALVRLQAGPGDLRP